MVKVNESTEELGYKFDADANYIYVSSGLAEFGFDREGAQRFIAQFIEWLADTGKAPKLEGSVCCFCLSIKEMMQRRERLSIEQRMEFMKHLREDHRLKEYAPEK